MKTRQHRGPDGFGDADVLRASRARTWSLGRKYFHTGEASEVPVERANRRAVFHAQRGQMRIRHKVAGGPGLLEESAKDAYMSPGWLHYHGWTGSEPGVHEIQGVRCAKWSGKDSRACRQPEEGKKDHPGEANRLSAAQRLLNPRLCAGVPRHAVVDRVQEHVRINNEHRLFAERENEHRLFAERELVQELLILERVG
jgi:hypothetical protein